MRGLAIAVSVLMIGSLWVTNVAAVGSDRSTAPQDKPKPPAAAKPIVVQPPTDAAQLPPVHEPIEVDRRDLGRAWLPPSPLEGVWQSSSFSINGRELQEGLRAFLIAGRSHLSIQILELPGPGAPISIQGGARTYRLENEVLTTASLLGYDNYGDRKLHLEAIGLIERRTVQFVGGKLRIVKAPGNWIEFTRIE